MKKILHLLALGDIGGIESQCVDIARYSNDENHFYFLWGGGINAEKISKITPNIIIRNLSNLYCLTEYGLFQKYVISNNIEYIIIQGVSPFMLIFSILLKKKYSNIKIILYLHANSEDLFKKIYIYKLFKWIYNLADGCIAISNSVKINMNKLCDTQKIHVIYNGTDCSKFKCIRNYQANSILNIIFVGRIVKVKGIDLLLKALSEVDFQYHLTIIGEGPEKQSLCNLAKNLNIDKNIQFAGSQNNIEKWLTKADIFVHPAWWNEGFGITLIEAMASGIPCIAFRRGAIPEIISDGINGYLIDTINYQALKDKLLYVNSQFTNHYSDYVSICKNAQQKALQFDIHNYIKNLSDYLETI